MDKLVIYQTKDHKTEIRVAFDDETVWLNRQQISDLFDRDIKTIGKHVNNVFKEGELDKDSVVVLLRQLLQTARHIKLNTTI